MQIIQFCLEMTVMMGAGVIAGRSGIADSAFAKKFSGLLVNLLIPCMVFTVMVNNYTAADLTISLAMMLGCIAVVGLGLLTAVTVRFLRRRKDDFSYLLLPMTMFMNANIIGFPVIQALYGDSALVYANFFMIPYRPLFYTLMPLLTQGLSDNVDRSWWKAMLHALNTPSIYATFLGLFFAVTDLRLPVPVFSAIEKLGNTAIPLGMLACGMYVSDLKISRALSRTEDWIAVICRNLLVPTFVLVLFLLLRVPTTVTKLCVIFAALPIPSMSALYASQYGRDSALAASSVFLSTALSVLSIPLWAMILEQIIKPIL